jgi:hypothetical protein
MSGTAERREPVDDAESARPDVSVCETTPEKFAFIEDGNSDGWIATDTVVDVRE